MLKTIADVASTISDLLSQNAAFLEHCTVLAGKVKLMALGLVCMNQHTEQQIPSGVDSSSLCSAAGSQRS